MKQCQRTARARRSSTARPAEFTACGYSGLSFRFGPRGLPALRLAPEQRRSDACAARANPNGTNFQLDTPLHLAAAENHSDCVALLISCGAKIEARNKDGFTPFLSATWFGAVDCMRVLHANGAKIKRQKTKGGQTAAHVAAVCGEVGALMLLEELGVNLHKEEADIGLLLGLPRVRQFLDQKAIGNQCQNRSTTAYSMKHRIGKSLNAKGYQRCTSALVAVLLCSVSFKTKWDRLSSQSQSKSNLGSGYSSPWEQALVRGPRLEEPDL